MEVTTSGIIGTTIEETVLPTMDVIRVGNGPVTVVALHGIQGTRAAWLPLARALADDATFVLPNLQGRGAAPRPADADGYTLAAYAGSVRAVVERHVADRPFVLAGWSMGVSVALQYAARHAGALAPCGLLLLSGTPCLRDTRWFRATADDRLMAEISAREKRLALTEAADHAAVAHTWRQIRDSDQRDLLAGLAMPALVIHGREDGDCPWPHAEALAQALPAARLAPLDDAGHSLLTANTGAVAALARAWLRGLRA